MKKNHIEIRPFSRYRLNGLFRLTATAIAVQFSCAMAHTAPRVSVIFRTGDYEITDFLGNPLSAGLPTVDHDGTVVQLGYIRPLQPGLLEWVSLTGEGSANTVFANSTIGDRTSLVTMDGRFSDFWHFTIGSPTMGQNLPTPGMQLSVRFFDGTTIDEAFAYAEVTNPLWLWGVPQEAPNQPIVVMSLNDPGTTMLRGRSLPFDYKVRTDTSWGNVPEPTSFLLAATGALMLAGRRRHCGS